MSEGLYGTIAAAYVRYRLRSSEACGDLETVEKGLAAGLRLHRFKRTAGLPRVRRVLGILRSLHPETLVDVGSGRGAFLWPLLDAFEALPVLSVNRDISRVRFAHAVASGGISRLGALNGDVTRLPLHTRHADVVTVLEVLEHLERPEAAAAEALRAARRFVVASAPSSPDDNPEHVQFFRPGALEQLFLKAGAQKAPSEYVLNHAIVVVRVR